MTDRYLFTPLRTPLTLLTPKTRFADSSNRTPRPLADIKSRLVLDENTEAEPNDPELHIGLAYLQGPDCSQVFKDLEAEACRSVFALEDWEDEQGLGLLHTEKLEMTLNAPKTEADTSEEDQEREIEAFVSASLRSEDLL